jgi:hypothetical protein
MARRLCQGQWRRTLRIVPTQILNRDHLLVEFEDQLHLLHREPNGRGHLRRRRSALVSALQLLVSASHTAGNFGEVSRHPDGPSLLEDGPSDVCANPPARIGAKLVPPAGIEFLHGAHEPQIALLHQVEQRHPMLRELLGDAHDKA